MLAGVSELELGPLRFGIIGAGRLGLALGRALQQRDFEVVHVAAPSSASRERATQILEVPAHEDPLLVTEQVDCVVLCVPDDRLGELVTQLAQRPATASPIRLRYVSTSAAGGLTALAPLAALGHDTCVLHPVASFVETDGDPTPFAGAGAAIGSNDAATATLANALAHALGLLPFELAKDSWPIHAAACTAASTLVGTQLALAAELARSAGMHETAARGTYGRIAADAVRRFVEHGTLASRGGAVARGDSAAVGVQVLAVRRGASSYEELFDAGLAVAINDAFVSGAIDVESARRMSAAVGAAMNAPIADEGRSDT